MLNALLSTYMDYYKIENITDFSILTDLTSSLNGIKNRFRLSILLFLKDMSDFSFSEIQTYADKKKSVISNHLKKLEMTGFIQNYYQKKKNSNEYSFYKLTDYGKDILSNLIKSYNKFYKKDETYSFRFT
jgi:DNA-binding MarR family transcriptional regulator